MTDPITPPPELVEQWRNEWIERREPSGWVGYYLATQAANWGADQELEACVDWMRGSLTPFMPRQAADQLRAARRPEPPSLKAQALALLDPEQDGLPLTRAEADTIRRALEQLDE